MGNSTEAVYHHLESETFEDVELTTRDFDCVLVFDIGSSDKDWEAPLDPKEIHYEYLKLLDSVDKQKRKELFVSDGASFKYKQTTEKDFYKNERKLVIKALTKLHIKCKHITAMTKQFETDKNLKFYYIGIGERVARHFAHKIEYELELDTEPAISYLNLMDEPLAKATVDDSVETDECNEKDWANIYIKYDSRIAPEIYKPFDVLDSGDRKDNFEDSLFRIRDRLALINEIVTQDIELGGCGIQVQQLQLREHCIVDFYPLHTVPHLECVLERLFSFKALTYNVLSLPLEEIRSYFGEYIGLYFAYLEFMTIYFVPLAVIGFVLQIMQWSEGIVLVNGIQYFALCVILWSVLFPILWKRKEFEWALKWGSLRFDMTERPRAEFDGFYRKSNVTGQFEEYFPRHVRNSRRIINFGIVASFLTALFGSVLAIVALRVYVAESDTEYGDYYISVANAFVIMFFNNIYGILAEKLNKWENYRTETEYENNLIIKIFIFRFINSYATLYYICFFRRYETDAALHCEAEDCMQDLAGQLGTIFITQLTVSNAIELGSLFVARCAKGQTVSYFTNDEKDSIWAQYSSQIYERTFDDYCELLVSFGYATLFVISFPLAPLAAFLGCIVEARIDGYKLCKLTRRPFPRQADDVGTWQLAMECMGWAVLLTNLAIICFTAQDLDFALGISDTYFEETMTAVILFAALFVIIISMNYCIASKPYSVSSHEKRQNHLEKSCKDIGSNIERYFDSLTTQELKGFKSWNAQKVAYFLRETCFKNASEYRPLESQIRYARFSGKYFNEADEHSLEKRLGITDAYQQKFVLNARRVLEEHCIAAERQDQWFETVHEEKGQNIPNRPDFQFSNDDLMKMADFFEEDLTAQSKRKLWAKVNKNQSTVVEKTEMENFLYFSIVVYIKAKYSRVRLPKKSDKKFKNRILKPLQKWMLKYKVSHQGLTFSEFNRFFPSWLREYYKEVTAVVSGGTSKYQTIRNINVSNLDTSVSISVQSESGSESGAQQKKRRKLGNLLSGFAFGGSMSETELSQSGFGFEEVNRQNWTSESLNWEMKLESVARAINKTDNNTRTKIWNKFDPKRVERLDCNNSLSKVIYALVALYVKTKDRDGKPPKFNVLKPLLESICRDILIMINSASGDKDNTYISKQDFEENISVYLRKIAHQRKQSRRK